MSKKVITENSIMEALALLTDAGLIEWHRDQDEGALVNAKIKCRLIEGEAVEDAINVGVTLECWDGLHVFHLRPWAERQHEHDGKVAARRTAMTKEGSKSTVLVN